MASLLAASSAGVRGAGAFVLLPPAALGLVPLAFVLLAFVLLALAAALAGRFVALVVPAGS